MPDFPDTFSGALGGATLGVQQQQANTQQQSVGNNFNIAQEGLKLQQQQQQNQQQRELFARADKERTNLMTVTSDTIEQLKLHGVDTATIAKQIQPLVQAAKRLAKSSGTDDTAIDAQVAATLAKPADAKTQADLGKPVKMGQSPDSGADVYGSYDTKAGRYKTTNLTDQNITGVSVEDAPLAGTGQLPDSAIDMMARQLNEGNTSVLTNLGRGKQSGVIVQKVRARAAKIMMDEGGLSAQDAAQAANANSAEYLAMKRGASALGQREAQVTGAGTTAMATAPRVLEASKLVDRTKYPALNSVLLAWKEGTGDENVVRLGIAMNTFVNNYARALGAGSAVLTDTARKEAWENLRKSWSSGQVEAAIDQMLNKELPSELTGAKMGLKTFIKNFKEGKTPATKDEKKKYTFDPETGELK
jgi:hypothetical protein